MPTRTPKRALAAVFAAVTLVTSVFAVPGVCAEPPADVVVGFVDRPEPGYYSRTVMPTLAAMARAMPDRTVTGVRLSPDDPIADLMRLRPDILVAPASVYMELELNYGGHAIATRKTRWADNPSASVGAAVVVRADNNEIRTLADLRGRRMASGGADAVDGWLALAYELKERRLRPEAYRAHTTFLNFPMPDVISAVLSGKVEAGVLSTCMLERAELAGLLKPGALRVVDEKTTQGFSCRHSTALYPDIVVAALPRTAPDVVKATTLALLSMPKNADFAWQVATNFVSVNRLYKELHLGPWKHLDDWSWRNLWKSYGTYALIILGFLAWLVLDEIRLKQTVRRRTAALTQALAEREKLEAQEAAARARLARIERTGAIKIQSNKLPPCRGNANPPPTAGAEKPHSLENKRRETNKRQKENKIAATADPHRRRRQGTCRILRAFARDDGLGHRRVYERQAVPQQRRPVAPRLHRA